MSSQPSSIQMEANKGFAPAPVNANAKLEHPTEFHKFWNVGIKEHLAKLVRDYPFVVTTMTFAAAFFGMMNIITFSPSCFIGSAILLSFALTLATATYYSVEGESSAGTLLNLGAHFGSSMKSAYNAFAWALSSVKAVQAH